MDTVVIPPNVSSRSEFERNYALSTKKSGKDLLNRQRSPMMVYERAAVFLQQLKPTRSNQPGDPLLNRKASRTDSYQYKRSTCAVHSDRDRINELISKQEMSSKDNHSSCSHLQPPTTSSFSENCSISDYAPKCGSMEKFRKSPSSISIHSQKITHYQMHECPLMGDVYRCKEQDPLFHIYGDRFTAPLMASSQLLSKPGLSALASNVSLDTKPSEHEQLTTGSAQPNPLPSISYIPPKEFKVSSVPSADLAPTTDHTSETEYRTLALISTIIIFILGHVLAPSFNYMDRFKQILDRFLINCWIRWELSSILQRNKCSTMNLIIFGPLMAIMGTIYSAFWIVYTLVKLLLSPAPERFVRNFKFEKFFGDIK